MVHADKQPELCSDSNVFSRALKSEVTIEDAEIQVPGSSSFVLLCNKQRCLYR